MPTRRQTQKAATRAKVLAGAREAFTAHGYEAVNLRELAKSLGLSTGSIFTSFESKADLYAEAMGHPPVSAEIGAGLLSVLKGALAGSFDRERAAAIVAQFEGA